MIQECLQWAKEAYVRHDSGTKIEENKFCLHDTNTDAQAFVIQEEDRTVISFRGTTTITDWMHDFKIWRRRIPYLKNAWIHSGFMEQYNALRESVLDKIQPNKPVICTGHSLGGALATVATLDIVLNKNCVNAVSCCTFGSPRVGSVFFKKLFNKHVKTSTRCVFKKDPITFTPFPVRFRHVKGVHYFNDDGVVKGETKNSSRCCIGCQVGHHSLDMYQTGINNL